MNNILVKKLSDQAIIPTKKDGDAGFDLYSIEDYTIRPLERKLFKTDIAMAIPRGYFGRIVDRSGNALNKGLHTMAGVIDSTYRGNIGVVLINLNVQWHRDMMISEQLCRLKCIGEDIEIKAGDRIAQMIIEKYDDSKLIEVDKLEQTDRAAQGFGSSGD